MSNRFTKATLLAGTFMAGAMIAAPAVAQDAASEGVAATSNEAFIVVTGSRIQRRNVDTAAPVAVVDAEEFSLSGTVNVENVINTLPQVVPGTTSFSNNPGTGAATLNLRGLGSQRTLVLVNGRRWMSYDTNQIVDLNTIPSFLLDSVDVVTGGASAVYGSDALAGVVNFRLKEVEGVEIGSQYSITERGDGQRFQVSGAIGTSFDDGRGSATIYAEYYKRDSIFQSDRDFSNFALSDRSFGPSLRQGGSSLIEQGRLGYRGNGDTTGTAFDANGLAVFNTPGQITARNGETYNYAPANYLQIPQERYLGGGYANYEFSDAGHEVYGEVSFVNNRVAQELAPTPILVNQNIDIASLSPFFTADTISQLNQLDASETGTQANDGLVSVQVRRRLTEAGSRNSLDERTAFRVLGGVRGPITDTINYDAYYSYARTRNSNIQQGNASISRFTAGLDGTGPTPINIFGFGTLTPEMVDAFRIQAQNGDVSTLSVLTGVASGTFGDFAIGEADPVGFAVGVERREVASQFLPDEFLASGDVAGFNAGSPTAGGYDVKEVFGELSVPVQFGGARLQFSGAARYSDYSLDLVGGAFTYAGGVEFSPIPDVTLRGQYQRAIRAPNVGELFQGSAIGFPGATDPCGTPAAVAAGNLRSQCLANGVPAANIGNKALIQPDSQTAAFFGGNANLAEEVSDSYTFGVVLQPRFIPGLTITADYFNIAIDDAITTISLQTALDLCFDGSSTGVGTVNCLPFTGTRDVVGAFDRNDAPRLGGANIAKLEVSGIDLEVNYTTTLPFSLLTDSGEQQLNLSFLGTWNEKNAFSPDQNDLTNVIECAGFFGATCGQPTPTYKWTSRASFVDGPMTTSIRWRHVGSTVDDDPGYDYAAAGGVEKLNSYDLLDLTLSFEASENLTLAFGVNNVFDTLPGAPTFDAGGLVTNRPNSLLLGDNQEQANTYPSTYDVLGRDFFVSASMKF
jgi:iron complex outermembrane receptor protein